MSFTMGPPVDSREIIYQASHGQYLWSIFLGSMLLLLSYRLRQKELPAKFLFSIGIVFLTTLPWIGSLTDAVIGAYPTIDKEGSLLFYLDGVHRRVLLSPSEALQDPAHRLIGFHLGHFWVVAFFDLFLSPFSSYNAQILLNLVLNVFCGIVLLEKMHVTVQNQLIFGTILGLQLHVFRDIHWYTVEKSSLYLLFLFWIYTIELCKVNLSKLYPWWGLGFIYVLATWMNFYWGVLLALLGGLYAFRMLLSRQHVVHLWKALLCCGLLGLGIAWIQLQLSAPHQSFASPEQFQQRASLDSFTLSPLSWNRMGIWRAINPVVLLLLYTAHKQKQITRFEWITAGLFFLLSLGPSIFEFQNPLYALFSLLPGIWRFAKPEIFFLLTYTLLICWAARVQLSNTLRIISVSLLLFCWIIGLKSSPGYPYLTEYIPATLPNNWEQRFFSVPP